LDGLAEGTFGLHKSGTGAHAPVLYQEGKYAELFAYNLQDVRLTKKLFEFIKEYGFVVDRAGRRIWIGANNAEGPEKKDQNEGKRDLEQAEDGVL